MVGRKPRRQEREDERRRRLEMLSLRNNSRRTQVQQDGGGTESVSQYGQRLLSQRQRNQRRLSAAQVLDIRAGASPAEDGVAVETEENRARRLRAQQAYDQQHRVNRSDAPTFDSSHLAPISQDTIHEIEADLARVLGAEGLDECACAVCDRLSLRRSSLLVHLSDAAYLQKMKEALRLPAEGLPPLLAAQYDCADLHECFSGLLLSRSGISVAAAGVVVRVCCECNSSLVKDSSKPPKFAIANGFFVGYLPENLSQATWIEKIMTQLVTVVAQTRVMRGGQHRAIRSHCMVFDAMPGPPATLLPRRIDRDGSYRVVLAGPLTTRQHETIRKLHDARGTVVEGLLAFFKANNHFYAGVQVDRGAIEGIESDVTRCDRIFIQHEEDDLVETSIADQQDSVLGRSDYGRLGENEDECTVIERNILLAPEEVVPDVSFTQRVVDLNPNQPAAVPQLRVDHSSRFASSVNLDAKMHAHLFPFGRGHPGEERATNVSKRDCLRYYSMLSSRKFAQDPTFMLAAFARLAMETMYTMTSVKCRRYSSIFEGYEALSREDLTTALINNERRQRGQSRINSPNPLADRFLKSVELGSMSVWGSAAERRQCRQEAFGYQTRHGQPTLFVTLTPNSDNSYAMAHYTGVLSVNTLFDSLEARPPSRAEMKKAAMMDDCASARLFMRTVDAFIDHVLGVDPTTKRCRQRGGLFGRTRAYFGMVETQGRGTLHIHFLVWLYGAPTNAADFEEKLQRDGVSFTDSLAQYVDSIVKNSLPLDVRKTRCVDCGAAGEIGALPIPHSAHKQRRKKTGDTVLEPLLVECRSCGLKSSAQHIVRQLLLQNRPPYWPPPLRPLTDAEKKDRIHRESPARLSTVEASTVVREREFLLSALERSDSDIVAEWELNSNDAPQLPYTRPDDDMMVRDSMARLIEMTPPSLDVERMAKNDHAYMIASLVSNLNMHWWTHTGSCFKRSAATDSASLCRYGFPRERVSASKVSGAETTLSRAVTEEYVNGYNPSIMASFKCNHDVQFLSGGKDALNRIYYCCKYVTKPQHQIDSTTAIALASFQRRQNKEAEEAIAGAPASLSDIQRRRVTSMVYTFTNKQEIAGPLAALYLLRGSCCYSSDICAKLPLTDILKQLESDGDYSCTLVEVESGGSANNSGGGYRTASFLDDYVYRPSSNKDMSLYEFTMRCYRRQRTPTSLASHLFHDDHPLSASHCLGYRRGNREAVPVIKGRQVSRLTDDMSEDAREMFAKAALVLFKPFRVVGDLIGAHNGEPSPWYSSYGAWEGGRSEFTKMIMRNMDDYHDGRVRDDAAVLETGGIEERAVDDTDSDNSDDDAYFSEDAEGCFGEDSVDNVDVLDMIMGANTALADMRVFPGPDTFPVRIQAMLAAFRLHELVKGIAHGVAASYEQLRSSRVGVHSGFTAEALKKWVKDSTFDLAVRTDDSSDTSTTPMMSERSTTVTEIIDESLQPSELVWSPTNTRRGAPSEVAIYCGIAAASQAYTLNELQHGAFAIIATHLLRRWRPHSSHLDADYLVPDTILQQQQLLLYMGGEGGTGKSRVISAVQQFCRSWQRPGSTIVTALTGKAASIINGQTLASLEMVLKGASSHAALQDVDCIIVDEVSMMSKDQLLRLDRLLRKGKRIQNVPFGGIFIILVGDFLQLPPVGADPLFIDPRTKTKVTLVDFEGFNLWRRFQKVVILRESVRFRDDPPWGEGCSKARQGEWTPEFIAMINNQLVGQSEYPATFAPDGTVFVTPDNDARTAINGQFVATTADLLPSHRFPIRIVANFKGALNKLSNDDICHIMSLPDSKFGRIAPFLDLIPGMPIQVTQNVRTKKGVANGTMGILHSLHFPTGTAFSKAQDRRSGVVFLLPDKRPLYAMLKIHRGDDAPAISEGLESDLFPVFPDCEAFKKVTIPLTKSSTGELRNLTLKIQQFPFVCSVGATVYKVQGESLHSMAVVDWKGDVAQANKPQQAYLMVSRVVKRTGLICLKEFTQDIADWSKPPPAAIAEDRRLLAESERTLSEFYKSLAE